MVGVGAGDRMIIPEARAGLLKRHAMLFGIGGGFL
jgi:hypothetical protein